MALLDHKGECVFPIAKDKVFTAMLHGIPKIKGMRINCFDKLLGRIIVSAGVRRFSWDENIPVQFIELSKNKTKVQIASPPKGEMMFEGDFDMRKNRKNIEAILSVTSNMLEKSM